MIFLVGAIFLFLMNRQIKHIFVYFQFLINFAMQWFNTYVLSKYKTVTRELVTFHVYHCIYIVNKLSFFRLADLILVYVYNTHISLSAGILAY